MYGDINPDKLQTQESAVQAMVYDPINAPDCVYMAVDNLMKVEEAGHAPYTLSQAVNMAYIVVLSKTRKFENLLRE